MPLYEFKSNLNQSFSFSDCNIAIERFSSEGQVDYSELSKLDTHHIQSASWALVYDGEHSAHRSLVNLLLISFRIFLDQSPPFIKYRLYKAENQVIKLSQPMTYNYSVKKRKISFDGRSLLQVNEGFQHLRKMDMISTRTRNSLYFLYRAFHAEKWIDSFILMTCSLESLFSKDAHGGATDAIASRVSSLLGSQVRCTKKDVENLYDLRSEMTHGRLEVSDDPGENLRHLEHLEFVTIRCFRELARNNAYEHYRSKLTRDRFMGALNTSQ
jgi:hypothetical protein